MAIFFVHVSFIAAYFAHLAISPQAFELSVYAEIAVSTSLVALSVFCIYAALSAFYAAASLKENFKKLNEALPDMVQFSKNDYSNRALVFSITCTLICIDVLVLYLILK